MYSLHAHRHAWVLFSDILCQGLKLQEVPSLVSWVIFPWWVKLFQQDGLCPSKSPATVSCHLEWSLNSACALCLLIFSVSSSCEPNKDPFARAACTLCPSPAVLQSCKSLSLLTGVQFLLAAVMACILGALILGALILGAWSPKRAWEVSSLQRGLF